uniref:Large ribosomal subunit protein uL4c n=1 Tax=Sphondylothamnion multifidum TaxID=193186 RepID=A0A4D6X4Y3_9FLOR|nr:ribosomal protein L4 [Sphondylothamnion multifidum]
MIINKNRQYNIIKDTSKYNEENNISSTEINFKINNNDKENIYLIHRALKSQLYQRRQGNAHTKTRDEIRGGGKKPWKQKGTGRARAGSTRSPLWKGGGVIFGPRSKDYKSKINKKEKKLAIQNVIYNKFTKTLVIQKNFDNLEKPSTKSIMEYLNNLNIDRNKKIKILIIVAKKTKNLYLSLRNIPNIDLIQANQINLFALLKADTILITFDGLNIIKKIYNE